MTALDNIDDVLGRSGVCILPTETVYGLAGKADDQIAIDKIYAIKGRDFDKPLAVCVSDIGMARKYGKMSLETLIIAGNFWPGPLTLVVPAHDDRGLDSRVYGHAPDGTLTIALRFPKADWAFKLHNMPLALTSANKSGEPDSYTAETSINNQVDEILDTGPSEEKIPSTIISVINDEVRILRWGAIDAEKLAEHKIAWSE